MVPLLIHYILIIVNTISYGIIQHHVLVPGPSSFALPGAFKKDLNQFTQNVYPGVGFVGFRMLHFFDITEHTIYKKECRVRCF